MSASSVRAVASPSAPQPSMASEPSPPSTVSRPSPPSMPSSPPPPSSSSSPSSPVSRSSPGPPSRTSSPAPPARASSPAPPCSVSSPPAPRAVSAPLPPDRRRRPHRRPACPCPCRPTRCRLLRHPRSSPCPRHRPGCRALARRDHVVATAAVDAVVAAEPDDHVTATGADEGSACPVPTMVARRPSPRRGLEAGAATHTTIAAIAAREQAFRRASMPGEPPGRRRGVGSDIDLPAAIRSPRATEGYATSPVRGAPPGADRRDLRSAHDGCRRNHRRGRAALAVTVRAVVRSRRRTQRAELGGAGTTTRGAGTGVPRGRAASRRHVAMRCHTRPEALLVGVAAIIAGLDVVVSAPDACVTVLDDAGGLAGVTGPGSALVIRGTAPPPHSSIELLAASDRVRRVASGAPRGARSRRRPSRDADRAARRIAALAGSIWWSLRPRAGAPSPPFPPEP